MYTYLVTLDLDNKDSALTAIQDLGAKDLEFFHDGLLTLNSDVQLNLSIDGVQGFQEVLVAKEHCYIVFVDVESPLTREEISSLLVLKGARIVKYHEQTSAIQIDSDLPIDFDDVPGIDYVERAVEEEED